MRKLTAWVSTVGVTALAGAALLVGLAGPASASAADSPMFLGDNPLVSIFIGNYQVRN